MAVVNLLKERIIVREIKKRKENYNSNSIASYSCSRIPDCYSDSVLLTINTCSCLFSADKFRQKGTQLSETILGLLMTLLEFVENTRYNIYSDFTSVALRCHKAESRGHHWGLNTLLSGNCFNERSLLTITLPRGDQRCDIYIFILFEFFMKDAAGLTHFLSC